MRQVYGGDRLVSRIQTGGGMFVLWAALACVACGPSKSKGKVGAFCDNDSDCESGLCFENQCLDPDRDEDGDGLKNGVEVHKLKTNPLQGDTDNDGALDSVEVTDIDAPSNSDGDEIIDALESSLPIADDDKDCLADQYDPQNDVANLEMTSKVAELYCQKGGGVCTEQLRSVQASCEDGTPRCDYSAVEGYEEEETRCDGVDNDCDGQTDEGLGGLPCENANEHGSCTGVTSCSGGVLSCEGPLPAPETCNGEDENCNGQTDEGLDGLPCQNENEHGACEGVTSCSGGVLSCEGPLPAPETCNGEDENCNGQTDEGLAGIACENKNEYGVCQGVTVCDGQGGTVCDAREPAAETCNGLDDECDGQTDEGLDGLPCQNANEHGTCQGFTSCSGGVLSCVGPLPAPEACNGKDDDCDGPSDEEGAAGCQTYFFDKDQDGYGMTGTGKCLCEPEASYTAPVGGDCEDTVSSIHPGVVETCNSVDDNCDGGTDEDDICLKTSIVKGSVWDGETIKPVMGARIAFYKEEPGFRQQEPAAMVISDEQGRFEVPLVPGLYSVRVESQGYLPVETWVFVLRDQDQMPLDIALTPEGSERWFVSVCGRVYDAEGTTSPIPIPGASVTLFGDHFGNPLASTTTGPQGFYCISGVSGLAASGKPFQDFALRASAEGYLPGMVEYVPNVSGTLVIGDIYLIALPQGTQQFLHEDFESEKTSWTMDEPSQGVGWHWVQNGHYLNQAVPTCVALPAQFEVCEKAPEDPLDRCAICAKPSDAACIPTAGALPNAYAGSGAFWFGNPATANFLPDNGTCEPLSGGSGGPVSGSLVSPWFQTSYARPLYLSFWSAWEIESVDPQAPPDGYDQMLVEVQGAGGGVEPPWVVVGHLNPAVDVNGEPYQPYTSGGFNQAPVWVHYVFDLTPYSSYSEIRIRFRFDSKDEQYNAFRGWLVDEVEVFGVVPTR